MERKLSKIYTSYHNLFLLLAVLILGIFSTCNAKEITSSPVTPIKIIDGDSLEIGDKRIRLTGIDAPEYIQYCKDEHHNKYPCGKDSALFLKNMINNQPITCKVHKKDQYERYLCTCYVNNIDLNAEMIKSGNAVIYMETPYRKEQEFAKKNKKGLWKGRFMHPRLFRRLKEQENLN